MKQDAPAPPTALAVAIALTSVYLVWGSTYLAIRVGLEGYPPFLMGSLRFIAASLVFYAFLRWRGHAPPTRAQWKNAAVMGMFMMLMGNGLVNVAEQTVSSGLAAVAVGYLAAFGSIVGFSAYVWLLHHVRPALATSYAYVNPPIAVLLGALLLGERVGVDAIGAMAVILAGVIIITRAKARA
jgi:drug/metabolite transporter (DMT)-like permease